MAELIQYANGVPGIRWPLDKTIIRIGRSDNKNDITIDDGFASKAHAQIEVVLDENQTSIIYFVRDLDSTNHTYLNQKPIDHQQLNHNDTIVIGKSKFVFVVDGVRQYISPDHLISETADSLAVESEESLTIAVDEITEQFQGPATEDLVQEVLNSVSGRYKFSRRLNIY